MQEESRLWLKQAEEDLNTAEAIMKSSKFYASVFFAQQAAEKALKAVYIKKFNDLAKVHDLVFLGRKVGLSPEILEGCVYLNRAYIESRYPGDLKTPSEKFSKSEASKGIDIAKEVLVWVKKIL
ncbi:MAG: HEPN domain-containing protein [Candidatus Micrarchaeota archaeon]